MAWVGGAFYLLHAPAILTTLLAGRRLRELRGGRGAAGAGAEGGVEGEGAGYDAEEGGGGLAEPLLGGAGFGDHTGHGACHGHSHGHGHSHMEPASSGPLAFRRSSSAHRSSIPGHASPIAGSMG